MNAALAFRRLAVVQVLLALGAFAVSNRDEWFLVAGGVLAVASTYITEGPRGRYLPNWVVGPGVVLAGLWGVASFISNPEPRVVSGVVGVVVLTILMLKLYGRKNPSDWRQILALTVVMVVAAALNSTDLLVGVCVMAYAAVTLANAMLYQLYAGVHRAQTERTTLVASSMADQAGRAVPALHPATGAHGGRQLARVLLASCAMGLLVSVLVFVLFPRESFQGDHMRAGSRAGFSTELWLRSGETISVSARELFSVRMRDPQGTPMAFGSTLYLRGAVLDSYDPMSMAWVPSGRHEPMATLSSPGEGEYALLAVEADAERVNVWTQEVEMRAMASSRVFSMWLPLAIATPDERTFTINLQNAILAYTSDRSGRPWRYAVRVQPYPRGDLVRAIVPASGSQEPYVPVSFPVPAVRAVAERILTDAGFADILEEDPARLSSEERHERSRRIARMFTDYLQQEEFRYTVDLSGFIHIRNEDANVSFLTRYKFGHCEYFASALAALCRSMGVEARVVTGFAVSEYEPALAQYVARESNAHAWVEVRTGEWQWSTYDPSPPQDLLLVQNANRGWLDRFRWVLDPFEFAWQSRVVSFDSGSQGELAERLRRSMEETMSAVRMWAEHMARDVNRAFRLGPAGYIWLGMVGVVVVTALAAAWVLARRDRLVRTLLGASTARALARARLGQDARFYLDALRVLRQFGYAKPRWRTPAAHAEALRASAGPAAADAFMRVVERFYAVRYAGLRPARAQRASDMALVSALRTTMTRSYTRAT